MLLFRNYIFFLLIYLVLSPGCIFIISSTSFNISSNVLNNYESSLSVSSPVYIEHEPILIESDADFISYNFSGLGSREEPYIIQEYNITSNGAFSIAIDIKNTNAFFVINNCLIYTDYLGIALDNVGSGSSKITRNTIISLTGDGGGILLNDMNNCTISNNKCSNFMQGIHLNLAHYCTIQDNYVYNLHYQGINIRYSNSNKIVNNGIKNVQEHGIAMVGTSSYNIIHHNILEANTWADSYDIDGTPKGKPTSQAYDEGSHNVWYDTTSEYGNIWSDYFGIGPYRIDGPSNTVDLYPRPLTGLTPFTIIIISSSLGVIGLISVILFYRLSIKKRRLKA